MSITVNPYAIGWKHSHEPGIRCIKDPIAGDFELIKWPKTLGSYPTQEEANIWNQEYLVTFKIPEIQEEAERRIEAGTLIGENLIRCDDRSVSRLHGMLRKAERLEEQSKPVSLKFKTKAGVTIVITSAAEAGAVYDEISDHVSFVLGKSANLQDLPEEELLVLDPYDDAHWE